MKAKRFEYEGKEYDTYTASQKQRQIERTIRKLKRERDAYKAAGLNDEATATNVKIRRLSQKYTEFSKAAGLPEQRERMKVLDTYKNSFTLTKRSSTIKENLTKVTKSGKVVNPMNEQVYWVMRRGLEEQGVKFYEMLSGDDLRYMLKVGEAVYSDKTISHIGKIPSASGLAEEIIHYYQEQKYGIVYLGDVYEQTLREVSANRMLMKHGAEYGFDEIDFEDIAANLDYWEAEFKKVWRVAFDESGIDRFIPNTFWHNT